MPLPPRESTSDGCVPSRAQVNSPNWYTEHPEVINGCSNLLHHVFEERGIHARSAVGASALPRGVPVEIELIAEVDDDEVPSEMYRKYYEERGRTFDPDSSEDLKILEQMEKLDAETVAGGEAGGDDGATGEHRIRKRFARGCALAAARCCCTASLNQLCARCLL